MDPLPLDTEYLFTMDIAVGPPQPVSEGLRVVPVVGGTVRGPALTGEVINGASADWLRVEADGTAHMDVRFTVRAASGALVLVSYSGIRTGPPAVLARLGRGEAVPPADYYFRVAESGFEFQRGIGCDACGRSGYKGRAGVYELMEVTPDVQRLILASASSQEIKAAALPSGGALRDDAIRKIKAGVTTAEEVVRVTI